MLKRVLTVYKKFFFRSCYIAFDYLFEDAEQWKKSLIRVENKDGKTYIMEVNTTISDFIKKRHNSIVDLCIKQYRDYLNSIKLKSSSMDQAKLYYFYWIAICESLDTDEHLRDIHQKIVHLALIAGFDYFLAIKNRRITKEDKLHKTIIRTAIKGKSDIQEQFGKIGIYTTYKALLMDDHFHPLPPRRPLIASTPSPL